MVVKLGAYFSERRTTSGLQGTVRRISRAFLDFEVEPRPG